MTEEPRILVKEFYNILMRLFNKNIEEIKDKNRFPTTNNILKIKQNAKTIFNPKLINFDNKKHTNAKPMIEKARDIGGYITIKRNGENESAIKLYNELENIKDFKDLFDKYEVGPDRIYKFGRYLSKMRTEEEERINDLQNEVLETRQQKEKIEQDKEKIEAKYEKIENKHKDELKMIEKKHADELEAAKQDNASKEDIEELNRVHKQEIDVLENNTRKAKQELLTKFKHKIEERYEKRDEYIINEFKEGFKAAFGFSPSVRNYINDKVRDQAYSLEKDQLIDRIEKDIKGGYLPKETNPEVIVRAIYVNGSKDVMKRINRISNLAKLTGYNHDLYNKLPGDVAQEVQKFITDKIQDDIRRKNIKYILPKDKPRWEYAMQTKQINPMLGRSAWSV